LIPEFVEVIFKFFEKLLEAKLEEEKLLAFEVRPDWVLETYAWPLTFPILFPIAWLRIIFGLEVLLAAIINLKIIIYFLIRDCK
jgi:hypothetical protein